MEGFTFSLPEGADYSKIEWGSADAQANLASATPVIDSGKDDRGSVDDTYYYSPRATPPPAPTPPPAATTYSVKQPDASLVKYHPDVLPQELITDLLFEDVGGSELINIARYDTINGQDVVYSLVKNLSILNRSFNPNNILAGQTASSQFGQYSLDIASKLQSSYLDADGNLVIEFSSINNDEYAEIELSTNGTIYNIGMVIIG